MPKSKTIFFFRRFQIWPINAFDPKFLKNCEQIQCRLVPNTACFLLHFVRRISLLICIEGSYQHIFSDLCTSRQTLNGNWNRFKRITTAIFSQYVSFPQRSWKPSQFIAKYTPIYASPIFCRAARMTYFREYR